MFFFALTQLLIILISLFQCLSCGPDNTGQCIGPSICCVPFGCYIGTPETRVCQKENERRQACEITGEPCGSRGQGNCVANGICCDTSKYYIILFYYYFLMSFQLTFILFDSVFFFLTACFSYSQRT